MKKLASILLVLGLFFAPLETFAAYKDVSAVDPYFPAIQFFEKKGFLSDKKFFYPAALINKAEFLKLAWNIGGYKAQKNEKSLTKFKDVEANAWFAPYIKKSLATGTISFSEKDPYFHPGKTITRSEGLNIIFQTQGIGTTKIFKKEDLKFSDVKMTSDFAHLAKTALEFGLFENEKKFQANKKITRAEAVEWMYRIQEKLKSEVQNNVQIIQLISQPTLEDQDGQELIKNAKFELLVDVWKKIRHRFVDKNKIKNDELIYGAIEGLAKQLGDPYTSFQRPKNANTLTEQLAGQFDGIGISIDTIDGKVTIISPLKGTPAEKAGLRPNDIINKINGKPTENIPLEQIADMIKGASGTKVQLTILRSGKEIQYEIVRERIKIASVIGYMKNAVAVIELRNFGQTTYDEFLKELNPLLEQNPQGIILDLRNNPGGFLDVSLEILDHFLPKGTKISTLAFSSEESAKATYNQAKKLQSSRVTNKIPTEVEYVSIGKGDLSKYKIVIMQNKGSASAAEIVAASLRDNLKASIVGDKSFGKGSVQELIDYSDGSIFKISIARWLTPSGTNLTNNPIIPDYEVLENFDTADEDEALTKALSLFN